MEPLNYGWICPKCGRVYSPSTSQCPFCGGAYSPNVVYCGLNNDTRDLCDSVTINGTANSATVNTTFADGARHSLREELQDSLKNSRK